MATKVMECDLVVLGAGGVGLVAAVKAAEDSGKKVIVLEKAKKCGGGASFMHCFEIRDSKWQKDAGEKVNDPPSLSGQFFDWLASKGGAEEYWKVYKSTDLGSGFFGTLHMFKRTGIYKDLDDASIGPGWTGTYIADKMLECCKKTGIPVITSARGKKLLTDASGAITGVLADTPDGELQVNCKSCFIATGGFGADYKRLQKLFPVDFNNESIMCLAPPSLTGDGIDMAEAIGAHIDWDNIGVSFAGGVHHPYSYSIFCMILNKNTMKPWPESLLVTLEGARWGWPKGTHDMQSAGGGTGQKSESGPGSGPGSSPASGPESGPGGSGPGGPGPGGSAPSGSGSSGKAPSGPGFKYAPSPVSSLPGGAFYAVVDQNIAGILAKKLIAAEFDEPAVTRDEKWQQDLDYEAALDDSKISHGNHVKKANTLWELAIKMDIDPKVFLATVDKYNKQCDEGKDPDFGKDASGLIPLRNPPYYALYAHRFSQMTRGGIVTSGDLEVLDKNGKAIAGLFAGGVDASPTSSGGGGMRMGMGRAQTQGYNAGMLLGKHLKSLG